ncbi:caspase family protein [Candidatus Obscuribacterales bacterium]|nr:caspase family protein [Candidatus Obscuribacterales bacterium]
MMKATIAFIAIVCAALVTGQMPVRAQTVPPPVVAQTPATQSATVNKPVHDKWAIVVGVSKFANPEIPALKYASKDARDFYDYLVKEANFAPDHVRLILDEKATRRRILSELDNMFLGRVARPDDMIVLFFSTHGSPSQLDKMGKNFIVAYDTEPTELFATGIEMQSMTRDLKERVDAKRVLLVLDACHSGGVSPHSKGITRVGNFDTDTLAIGNGQMVICSSEPDQQSWESKRYNNGVFTRNLLEGLRSKGQNTTIEDAFGRINELVQDEVRQDYPGNRQSPVLKSKWEGEELILAVKPTNASPIPQSIVFDLEPDSTSSAASSGASSAHPAASVTSMVAMKTPGSGQRPPSEYAQKLPAPDAVLKLNVQYFSNEADPRKAYEFACQALATHKSNPDFAYKKAKIQIQLGRWGSAMQELKGVIVDNPNVADYYLARAYCFHKMKQEGNAQADLETAKFKDVFLPRTIEFDD